MFCRGIPYEGTEPYAFVNYCHLDGERISPIIEQMSLDGYRAWYDEGGQSGQNWLNIEEHLENCRVVIAFVSKNSRDSNNCNKVIVYAMKCGKKIIPILIEDVALPKGIRMQMAALRYLERKNFSSDRVLLQKCYEAEECAQCRSSTGSLPLRPAESAKSSKKAGVIPFKDLFKNLEQVDIGRRGKDRSGGVISFPPPEKEASGAPSEGNNLDSRPDSKARNKRETAAPEKDNRESSEDTIVPKDVPEDTGATIYVDSIENATDLGGDGIDVDVGRTVLISRSLAILLHPAAGKAYKLKSPKITIGRSPIRCDVTITGNDSISKVHAIIWQTKQKCYIEDANSTNGTFIDGEPIEPGQQIPLENPAVFQLNDETMILLSGAVAREFGKRSSISLLLNEAATAVRIMDADTLPLNRNHIWPDGTLSDRKIHRAAHALLCRQEDRIYLVDESPERGNGTHLNGSRLSLGEARPLSSGDKIRLGDTNLEFVSIEIPS